MIKPLNKRLVANKLREMRLVSRTKDENDGNHTYVIGDLIKLVHKSN